jgi:hypothetical protein
MRGLAQEPRYDLRKRPPVPVPQQSPIKPPSSRRLPPPRKPPKFSRQSSHARSTAPSTPPTKLPAKPASRVQPSRKKGKQGAVEKPDMQ